MSSRYPRTESESEAKNKLIGEIYEILYNILNG